MVGELEGELDWEEEREVVVDESSELERWLGDVDFEDEADPTEIF